MSANESVGKQPGTRCAIYARSATEQRHGDAIHEQLRACRLAAGEFGWTVNEEHIYIDGGVSGNVANRKTGLNALLKSAQASPQAFDRVLVADLSRPGPNFSVLTNLLKRFQAMGLALHIVASESVLKTRTFRCSSELYVGISGPRTIDIGEQTGK